MKKVLILGGGFASVSAAQEFARANDGSLEVTVVSASRGFVLYPALVPYVFGAVDAHEIRFDLASRLTASGIRFIEAEAISIDQKRRMAAITGTDVEGLLHFDYLLVALGRRAAAATIGGFHEFAHHLLDLESADKFRSAIDSFTAGSIVVALAPGGTLPIPVCETALGLADKFAAAIKKGTVSVSAVFPRGIDDALHGAGLFRDIGGAFEKKAVDLVENFPVERVTPRALYSVNGSCLRADLLMVVPPSRGHSRLLAQTTGSDAAGLAETNEYLQLGGDPYIYAAGDILSLPGPHFGYMAIRQGKLAARNIIAHAAGRPKLESYEHKIEWLLSERYTDASFFHYGFWDESLDDFDENDLFGMARPVRRSYGSIKGFGRQLDTQASPVPASIRQHS